MKNISLGLAILLMVAPAYGKGERTMEMQSQWINDVACLTDTEGELAQKVVIGGTYQHYRNKKMYRIESIGRHTETEELMVVYKPLDMDQVFKDSIWIRPLAMFCETVEHDGREMPRFSFVK